MGYAAVVTMRNILLFMTMMTKTQLTDYEKL